MSANSYDVQITEVSTPCNIGEAWMASGTAFVSAQSLQRGIAMEFELSIIEGFSNPLVPPDLPVTQYSPVAHFSIVFESNCADSSCTLYIIERSMEHLKTQQYHFLAAFNGSQPRRVWSHSIVRQSSTSFVIAFVRSGAITGDDSILDQARIFSINVTNIGANRGFQGGGASRCLPCPKGRTGECVPCPPGHYMSPGKMCLWKSDTTYEGLLQIKYSIDHPLDEPLCFELSERFSISKQETKWSSISSDSKYGKFPVSKIAFWISDGRNICVHISKGVLWNVTRNRGKEEERDMLVGRKSSIRQTHECIHCPLNTVVNVSSERSGVENCIACGENLHSVNGITCTSHGTFTVERNNRTLRYDLSTWLNKTWTTSGVKVFAREGSSYYHSFNFSLFSEKIQCQEVYDSSDAASAEVVIGAACRLTVLLDVGSNRTTLAFISPLLLATRLEEISLRRIRNGWNLTDQLLEYEGVDESSRPIDVHFWFDSVGVPSEACPKGNAYVATARCTPSKKVPEFRLPYTCPDGTCDGCLFHAIVESVEACPICGAGDYRIIRGECVNGQQAIHYIPDKWSMAKRKYCGRRTSRMSARGIDRHCVLTGQEAQSRIEYKYTRLVESRNGELPGVETCGLEDDEDEASINYKLFARAFLNRIGRRLDEEKPREQTGFGTVDDIHTITRFIEVSGEYKKPLCLTFIDLKKALDSVETEAVMEALINQALPTPYIKILRELYQNFITKITVFYKDMINVREVRQCILFCQRYSNSLLRASCES
ncbi:hypothetical protein DICVIV_12334 [Dictyocaulus viviparus]|uniref:Elapor1/2 mannose 6-phosphate receptor homology domain-containing protein n=1 Tax=Dictyocaulus viviparus TaxID=29172 RepID=A0A0D8XD56_DICVI|nr:hypothetical protein DICVIV_12334 [Dictyocaulus viviparus]